MWRHRKPVRFGFKIRENTFLRWTPARHDHLLQNSLVLHVWSFSHVCCLFYFSYEPSVAIMVEIIAILFVGQLSTLFELVLQQRWRLPNRVPFTMAWQHYFNSLHQSWEEVRLTIWLVFVFWNSGYSCLTLKFRYSHRYLNPINYYPVLFIIQITWE